MSCIKHTQARAGCLALLLAATSGCAGDIDGSAGTSDVPGQPPGLAPTGEIPVGQDGTEYAPLVPHAVQMSRLTETQYKNSIRDVFGADIAIQTTLPLDNSVELFRSIGATVVTTSNTGVVQYLDAAEEITNQVFERQASYPTLASCTPSGPEDACISEFIRHFASKLWRRPVTDAELSAHAGIVFAGGNEPRFVELGMRRALTAVLQSPHFLYRPAFGELDPATGALRYTNFEMATRLAYALTDSTPDSALLEAAAAGTLVSPEAIELQALRLLDSERGKHAATRFFGEYFGVEKLADNSKDTNVFPEWTAQLADAYRSEFDQFLVDLVSRDGDAREIFNGRYSFIGPESSEIYGVTGAPGRSLLPEERAGLLTSGAFMAANGSAQKTSPVQRGVITAERLLCQTVPAPPANVDVSEFEQPNPDLFPTNRDRLDAHRQLAACAGCHALFDPFGIALERFDAIGRYRETQNSASIDTSVDWNDAETGQLRHFDDARSLAEFLGADGRVTDCLTQHLYAFALGHEPSVGEQGVVDSLQDAFSTSGFNIKQLMAKLVSSPGFRYLSKEEL